MIIQFSEDSKQNKAKAQQKYQKSLVLDKYFKMTKFLIIGLIVPNENFCSNLAFRSLFPLQYVFSLYFPFTFPKVLERRICLTIKNFFSC